MYIYAVLLWPACLISSSCMLISLVFYDKGLSRFWYGILNSVIEVWFVCLFCLLQRLTLLNMMILIFLTLLCCFFMCYRFDAFLTLLRWKMRLTISSWKGMGNKLDFKFFYCCLSSSLMMLMLFMGDLRGAWGLCCYIIWCVVKIRSEGCMVYCRM